jgi:hypothetical protein
MDSKQAFSHLLEQLGYETSVNLVKKDTPKEEIPLELDPIWSETRDKLHIDAMYFVANMPIIYFKRFESFDSAQIAEFHKNVWNQSLVPLIFIILPNDIRVYNGYEAPRKTNLSIVTLRLLVPCKASIQASSFRRNR